MISLLSISMAVAGLLVLAAIFRSEPKHKSEIVDFNDVQAILKDAPPDLLIIDVREKPEFNAGHIPNAVNIPFFGANNAFSLDEQEFENRLGFKKPSPELKLLFYCRSGNRSKWAANQAYGCGYDKVLNYAGSYQDWTSLGGSIQR